MRYDDFRSTRYFAELDGLRAVSILLVVSIHSTDPIWAPLKGAVGVTVFFVISGFIITTLLLREEDRSGRVRITEFYLRRSFRILPIYYLMLAVYLLLVGVLHVQAGAADAWRVLPYYLTYQNDLVASSWGYSVTWSLAIEEKFYLLWPLVFLLPLALRRWRLPYTLAALVLAVPFAIVPGLPRYPAIFTPIILGCIVAQLMHRPAVYTALRPLTGTWVSAGLIALAAAELVLSENGSGQVHLVFALIIAAAMPAFLTGPEWLRSVLRSRVLVYVGTRSYGLYLVHRLAKGLIDRAIAPGGHVPAQLLRFALIILVGLAGAEVLRRAVEQPMIQLGKRVIERRRDRLAMRQSPPRHREHTRLVDAEPVFIEPALASDGADRAASPAESGTGVARGHRLG